LPSIGATDGDSFPSNKLVPVPIRSRRWRRLLSIDGRLDHFSRGDLAGGAVEAPAGIRTYSRRRSTLAKGSLLGADVDVA
jgi:hypothetical protein